MRQGDAPNAPIRPAHRGAHRIARWVANESRNARPRGEQMGDSVGKLRDRPQYSTRLQGLTGIQPPAPELPAHRQCTVCRSPALSWEKVWLGGVVWPTELSPSRFTLPSADKAQPCASRGSPLMFPPPGLRTPRRVASPGRRVVTPASQGTVATNGAGERHGRRDGNEAAARWGALPGRVLSQQDKLPSLAMAQRGPGDSNGLVASRRGLGKARGQVTPAGKCARACDGAGEIETAAARRVKDLGGSPDGLYVLNSMPTNRQHGCHRRARPATTCLNVAAG